MKVKKADVNRSHWITSLRRCPGSCGAKLFTNLKGRFECREVGCGYKDEQDIERYKDLAYPSIPPPPIALYGKKKIMRREYDAEWADVGNRTEG